jgi:FixJ family two-component response regulator
MITGRSDRDVVVESLNAGAVDFVVKPYDRDVLLPKISGLLKIAA